jgi:hypothetical protein
MMMACLDGNMKMTIVCHESLKRILPPETLPTTMTSTMLMGTRRKWATDPSRMNSYPYSNDDDEYDADGNKKKMGSGSKSYEFLSFLQEGCHIFHLSGKEW